MPQKEMFTYLSADGKTKIHACRWIPDEPPRAILQIAHGMVEYIDRYEPFALSLLPLRWEHAGFV